jgi:hypothetical protein
VRLFIFLGCLVGLLSGSIALAQDAEPLGDNDPTSFQVNPTTDLSAIRQNLTLAQRATPLQPRTMPVNRGVWLEALAFQTREFGGFTNVTTAITRAPALPVPIPTNEGAANARNTRIPVLAPTIAAVNLGNTPRTNLFARENFYTLSIQGSNVLIEVFGTRLAHTEPLDAVSDRRLRARLNRVSFTRIEGGVEASFSRFGAAYSVTVECRNGHSDPRCADNQYVERLVNSLLIIAGDPNAEQPE